MILMTNIYSYYPWSSQELVWSLEDVIGFFTTWSGYNSFMAKNPDSDILKNLEENLSNILGEKVNEKFHFLDQYFLVLMRKLK